MVAVAKKDVEAVEYYLSLGFSVKDKDSNGAPLMHHACEDLEMIKYVKSLGGDLVELDNEGQSVFHYSARKVNGENFSDFVKYFAENAPELLIQEDFSGATPLDLRKKEHPENWKGIQLLERSAASVKDQKNDESICIKI